jgi:hypothetical protein
LCDAVQAVYVSSYILHLQLNTLAPIPFNISNTTVEATHLTFPEAVPPATPIMKGDLAKVSGSRKEFFRGLGGGLKKRTSVWWMSCTKASDVESGARVLPTEAQGNIF